MKKIALKNILISIFLVATLSGCIVIIETPTYNPSKTLYSLRAAVLTESYNAITSLFDWDVTVWSKDDYNFIVTKQWTQIDAANFFFFKLNPYKPDSTIFNFRIVKTELYSGSRAAAITVDLEMKGIRESDNRIDHYVGRIIFYLRRTTGDNWNINGLDLCNFTLINSTTPKSISNL